MRTVVQTSNDYLVFNTRNTASRLVFNRFSRRATSLHILLALKASKLSQDLDSFRASIAGVTDLWYDYTTDGYLREDPVRMLDKSVSAKLESDGSTA
jgi:hypothetical protein